METIVLTDKSIEPNDEIVFSHIGEKRILWEQLMNHLKTVKKDMTGEWRYYNDGKSWLFRGLKKEKVVFWVGVVEGAFRVTFYLSGKAEELIANSNIPQHLKDGFESTKEQKFRSISILMNTEEDIESVKELIEIKLKVK
jgi:hypothetical protein